MADHANAPASLREAMGLPPESFLDRVRADPRHRGELVNRARRLVACGERPSDDELAGVLTGWLLRRR